MGLRIFIALTLVLIQHCWANLNGKPLNSNDTWVAPAHNVAGTVHVLDSRTFKIVNFVYATDGDVPPSGRFIVGRETSDNVRARDQASKLDPTSIYLPDELGRQIPLERYNGKDIIIMLPEGDSITNYTYLSIYCVQFKEYFGFVDIPDSFQPPAPHKVGQFTGHAHRVRSGDVWLLDSKTIRVESFNYDGQGPDAFWYVGNTTSVSRQGSPFGKIPDEHGSLEQPGAYSSETVVLTLPDEVTVYNIKWLSFFCIQYRHNFGEVLMGDLSDVYVPIITETVINNEGMNCEKLSDDLQVSWLVNDDKSEIRFQLAGKIERSQYMAFGLSGSPATFRMVGGDVVVTDWLENDQPRATDYLLSAYSQCSNSQGACPDTQYADDNGENNALMPTAVINEGITIISYSRAVETNDTRDQNYVVDGTSSQQILWGVGPINTKGTAAIHEVKISESKAINFGRAPANNCPDFATGGVETAKPDFLPHHIYGDTIDTFTAEIGQAGLSQGYKALTGNPSWGIAWYLNGVLIPELHLIRGKTYTFKVNGGNDPSKGSEYHPFYITDNQFGGYQESNNGRIYPGMVDSSEANFAVGDYCVWKAASDFLSKSASGEVFQCFEEFRFYLERTCPYSNTSTEFEWTPDANTPTPVYYQCYTHENLGWKIHVYDEADFPALTRIADQPCEFSTGSISTTPSSSSIATTSSRGSIDTTPSRGSMVIIPSLFILTTVYLFQLL